MDALIRISCSYRSTLKTPPQSYVSRLIRSSEAFHVSVYQSFDRSISGEPEEESPLTKYVIDYLSQNYLLMIRRKGKRVKTKPLFVHPLLHAMFANLTRTKEFILMMRMTITPQSEVVTIVMTLMNFLLGRQHNSALMMSKLASIYYINTILMCTIIDRKYLQCHRQLEADLEQCMRQIFHFYMPVLTSQQFPYSVCPKSKPNIWGSQEEVSDTVS